VAAINFASDEK